MVLSDLQAIDPIQLTLFQEEFESILNNCSQPIIKTMLFELLVQKGIECEVNFDSEMMSRQLKTTADSLDEFYEQLKPPFTFSLKLRWMRTQGNYSNNI